MLLVWSVCSSQLMTRTVPNNRFLGIVCRLPAIIVISQSQRRSTQRSKTHCHSNHTDGHIFAIPSTTAPGMRLGLPSNSGTLTSHSPCDTAGNVEPDHRLSPWASFARFCQSLRALHCDSLSLSSKFFVTPFPPHEPMHCCKSLLFLS